MEDLGAVVHLLTACDLADSGEPQWSEESLQSLWQADDVQVETDVSLRERELRPGDGP